MLKVKQGDWASIMIPSASADHKPQQPKRMCLRVTGILQLSGQLGHSFVTILVKDT